MDPRVAGKTADKQRDMIDTDLPPISQTSLQRALPTELRILLWSGQLREIAFNEYAALKMLSNAVCCIANAHTPVQGLLERFCGANEGVYALSLGVLYLHGVLPAGLVGHRAMAMQVACETMHLPTQPINQIIYANTHRELISYGSTEPVLADELLELLHLSDMALEQARYVYPDWFG